MFSRLALNLTACLAVHVFYAQNTIGVIDHQPDLVEHGYTLLYPHNQPHIYLLDMCGEVVHTWANEDTLRPGNMAYL